MKYVENPITVQFEISSMCNALCLGCQRTDSDNYNKSWSHIPAKQTVSRETIKKLLVSPAFSTVERIEFCGTIDEPLMHPEFLEILDDLYTINANYRIRIHTNASLRPIAFWKELANKLNRFNKPYIVFFSIDGLEDTHSIYRQFTDYNTIIRNAKAFIAAGGRATWQFLVFPWNAHQVEQARSISASLGFDEFRERNDRSGISEEGLDHVNESKRLDESYQAKPDTRTYEKYDDMDIDCFTKKEKMYFVSYDSKLWPCCFFGNARYMPVYEKFKERIFDNYGKTFNDLTLHTVEEILSSDLYQQDLVESWNNKVGCGTKDKVNRCAMICSVKALEKRPVASAHIFTKNS